MPAYKYLGTPVISIPCAGIDGVGSGCAKHDLSVKLANAFEINENLSTYLSEHCGYQVFPKSLLEVDFDTELQSSDVLFAGPPCTPWAGCGARQSWENPASKCMLRVVDMAAALHQKGDLKLVIIENTPDILYNRKGEAGVVRLQSYWAQSMPDWTPLHPWILDAGDYNHPFQRRRVFFLSVPRSFSRVLRLVGGFNCLPFPKPKPHPTKASLFRMLGAKWTLVKDEDITGNRMRTYRQQWAKIFSELPEQCGFKLSTCDASRSPNGKYNTVLMHNKLPSLTTQNRKIWVFGCGVAADFWLLSTGVSSRCANVLTVWASPPTRLTLCAVT